MTQEKILKDQELLLYAVFTLALLWMMFSLGPLVLVIAIMTLILLNALGASPPAAFGTAFVFAVTGMVLHRDMTLWLLSPVYTMHEFYEAALPHGLIFLLIRPGELTGFLVALTRQSWQGLETPALWFINMPVGVFCGASTYVLFALYAKNPLGNLKRQKIRNKAQEKIHGFSSLWLNQRAADTQSGSLIGADGRGRVIELSDKAANQHTLVLGTTGAGKTVTLCNIVESAINRKLPLIYIDGKGDYDLARRIARYGQGHGRAVSVFAMKGESVSYNPLATGGFTSKKDRIIELREWSEEHYKKLAEGYLQSVFKTMDRCGISCDMASLANHLDLKRLKTLVRENERNIPDAQNLMDELNNQDQASRSIESLVAEIRNFTSSEIGPLFRTGDGKPVLTLAHVLAENGIACFCLPALEFPAMSQTLGRLIINDLKATMAQQLGIGIKNKLYVIFDEFSVFAGEQVLNVINMGRSAGIHAVLSTQNLSDIASGRKENADHFINQVIGNCNNFILHRQNSPEDAEKLAAMMGTKQTLEYTAQISQTGPTHMGTVRRTRGFIAHPDEIKALKTGEAFFFSKENNKISRIKARMGRI